eukprot:TRINITY_DN3817_c0_g1_i1.p1 TRINITY_DN3817_c0_g1~~TRINITY_DN3817_c0_g1_i1.p1  ORF type:complete len:511 (+),score=186.48 TRINITY_DN3817_c0_g1_i1:515-2047(+)
MLTTVAPRAPAGQDNVIPEVLKVLPSLPYPEAGVGALLLRGGVGRMIHYTAGYLGAHGDLCLQHFEFLAHQVLPSLLRVPADNPALKRQCETSIINAIYVLVAEGAHHLCDKGAATVAQVVQTIGTLITNPALHLDSRAFLVMGAGSVVSALPEEGFGEAARSMASTLAEAVTVALNAQDPRIHDRTKLFFVFLQSLRPDFDGDPADSQPHPVIGVLGHVWPVVDRVLTQCSNNDTVMQEGFHCISACISLARYHAGAVVGPYLQLLLRAFQAHPMIFHLGSVRTIAGLYGSGPNDAARQMLCEVLEALGADVLRRLQDKRYLLAQPDIVGMYYDALACGVAQPQLAGLVLAKEWIKPVLATAMELLPECHHPKVMVAMLLFVSRLTGWIHRCLPPSVIPVSEASKSLVLQCLRPLCAALVGNLAAQASSTAQAIPVLANCLQSLVLLPEAREALPAAVAQIPDVYMTSDQKATFARDIFSQPNPSEFAGFIQDTAQACTAQYLKSCERG